MTNLSLFFALVIAPLSEDAHSKEASEMADAFRNIVSDWQKSVELKSTYVLRTGRSPNLKFVFSNEGPIAELKSEGHGVFHQKFPYRRMSIDYGDYTRAMSIVNADGSTVKTDTGAGGNFQLKPGQGMDVVNNSWDQVTKDDLWLAYDPKWHNTNDRATLSHYSSADESNLRACPKFQQQLSPLFPSKAVGWKPLDVRPDSETVAYSVKTEDDYVEIAVEATDSTRAEPERMIESVRFWMKSADQPVISRIHRITNYLKSGRTLEIDIRLTDFVNCPGGYVARHVIFAAGYGERVHVAEWRSDDLGEETPVHDDFVITIPETTKVRGFAKDIPTGTVRQLDIDQFSGESVVAPHAPAMGLDPLTRSPLDQENGSRNFGKVVFLLILNGVIGICLAAFAFLRRKSRRMKKE